MSATQPFQCCQCGKPAFIQRDADRQLYCANHAEETIEDGEPVTFIVVGPGAAARIQPVSPQPEKP